MFFSSTVVLILICYLVTLNLYYALQTRGHTSDSLSDVGSVIRMVLFNKSYYIS